MKPAIAALMLWSGLLGLLYLALAGLVVRHRYRAKVGVGDGGDPALPALRSRAQALPP